MKSKHLISILDLSLEDIVEIYAVTMDLKSKQKQGVQYTPLVGKTLAMIFSKPSTRTRVSFEVGIYQLGGLGLFLSGQDMQLRRGETIGDTAKTLSRYVNGIMIRTFSHKDVEDLAKYGSVPVINGLTDLEHPCQALADIFTVIEHKCRANTLKNKIAELKNLKFVYVGDGNNVAHSLMLLAAKLSMNITVITPSGYEPDKPIVRHAQDISKGTGASVTISGNIEDIKDADVIYTDVWASMGKDAEKEQRMSIFKPYQINAAAMSKAKPDCIVMHCLPAHRGEEITNEVVDSKNSVVFDEAENRLHVQKAIMIFLMK
ncbi:MAG: Ornithine carbamoyltransferase [Elusimicrobia bacterium ADurb.Bin231]|nr:MAG: Ornithine carbamoyltransferase [Elusimicrobia bacterium ADurb.Bin231]